MQETESEWAVDRADRGNAGLKDVGPLSRQQRRYLARQLEKEQARFGHVAKAASAGHFAHAAAA